MFYKNIDYLECHDFPCIPFVEAYIVVLSPATPLISFEVERNRLDIFAVKQPAHPIWFNLPILLGFYSGVYHVIPLRLENEVESISVVCRILPPFSWILSYFFIRSHLQGCCVSQ